MAKLAQLLQVTGVRVVASPDLDVLRDEGALKKLVEAVGGSWTTELQANYSKATHEFRTQSNPRLNKDVLHAVRGILDEEPGAIYDGVTRKRVSANLAVPSPWKALKQQGKAAMKADRAAANALLDELDRQGVVAVRVGELERFAPDLNVSKGERWLPGALADEAHKSPEARGHMRRLLGESSPTWEEGPALGTAAPGHPEQSAD